jgi:hypothetical protein
MDVWKKADIWLLVERIKGQTSVKGYLLKVAG